MGGLGYSQAPPDPRARRHRRALHSMQSAAYATCPNCGKPQSNALRRRAAGNQTFRSNRFWPKSPFVSPGLPNRATANWSEGTVSQRPPQGIGASQANKGTLQSGFSLRPIDPLKQSALMSVGVADNMPR